MRKGEPMPVFPAPAALESPDGVLPIEANARIIVPAGDEQLPWVGEMLSVELGKALGATDGKLKVVKENDLAGAPGVGSILLGTKASGSGVATRLGNLCNALPEKDGAYVLAVSPEGIAVLGRDAAGTFYGALTLLQLFTPTEPGEGEFVQAKVVDYPYHDYRGMRSALPRGEPKEGEITHDYYRDLLRLMAFCRLNHVWIQGCCYNVPQRRHPDMNWNDVLTVEQAKGIVDFARRRFLSMDGGCIWYWVYNEKYRHLAELYPDES